MFFLNRLILSCCLVSFSLIGCVEAYSKAEFNYSSSFFDNDLNPTTFDDMVDFSARLDVKDSIGLLGYKVRLLSTIDAVNDSRNRFLVEDLWIQFPIKQFTVKVGSQLINWTSLDVFHPVDVVNSYYLDGNYAYPQKIAEPAINLSYQFPTSTVSFFYFPTVQKPVFSNAQNRFSGSFVVNDVQAIGYDGQLLGSESINQVAFVYDFSAGRSDVHMHYINHIDRRQPVVALNSNSFDLTALFLPVEQVGIGLQSSYGFMLIKSEVVYRTFDDAVLSDYGSVFQHNHVQMAVGSEYTLFHQNNAESTFFLEYQYYAGVSKADRAGLGLFQNDVFVGYLLNLNDVRSTELFSSILIDLERSYEVLYSATLSRLLNEYCKLSLGVIAVVAKTQSDGLGLAQLAQTDHLFFKITYTL